MRSLATFLLFAFVFETTSPCYAQWPTHGAPVCTALGNQLHPALASDGVGGAIITWTDSRGGASDVYAQRLNSAGVNQWTIDGIVVATSAGSDYYPAVIPDGAGGAIIAWQHAIAFGRIYVQRLNAAGVPQWAANGVAVSGATLDDQGFPQLLADGAGGAIITWADYRSTLDEDVYAQRVDPAGVPQWSANGVPVCTAIGNQRSQQLVSDGTGGVIVVWHDERAYTGSNYDVYVQRVDASGTPQWVTDGVVLGTGSNIPTGGPMLVADGVGGAIVTWEDFRNVFVYDIYAQRVNSLGAPQWSPTGEVVCGAADLQFNPSILPDGSGGAIIAWADQRAGSSRDMYVQRMNASGVPQWTLDGVALTASMSPTFTELPQVVSDGAGGAIVTWEDSRSGSTDYDVYARRVDASGTPLWATGGVSLCSAAENQWDPRIISDGSGGAIVAWRDFRSGNWDVYAQRVGAEGSIPTGVAYKPFAAALALTPNYPNPLAGETAMNLVLGSDADVTAEVFDVMGRRVRAIDLGRVHAGTTHLSFEGRDDHAHDLPSGVYFYRVHVGGETVTRKMVIAR